MPLRTTLFAALCLLSIGAAGILSSASRGVQAETASPLAVQLQIPQAAVPIAERQVCSLLDLTTGNGAAIAGQDEGGSLRVGDKSYWGFGDTLLNNGQPFLPNNIATASFTDDPADCLQLDHKRSSAGVAVPLLAQANDPDEDTLWPDGMVAAVPGYVHFFFASVSTEVAPFSVRFMALGKFDTATLTGSRVAATATSVPFWPLSYGIKGARPVLIGDLVYVFLLTPPDQRVKLARVPRSDIENVAAYTYWDADTHTFTADFAQADVILSEPYSQMPTEIAWNAFLNKWTMVYAGDFNTREMIRVADDITGPWSDPATLFDCPTYYPGPGVLSTYCYSGHQHEELQKSNGETIYATVSNEVDYRSFLHEIKLATPVRQYTDLGGRHSYVAVKGSIAAPAITPDGVAFYAGASQGQGLSPIHQWIAGAEMVYAAASPGTAFSDAGVAFYAPMSAQVFYDPVSFGGPRRTRLAYEPVYRWDRRDVTPPDHVYSQFPSVPGYTRGPVAFFAPCPDTDGDGANDCTEASQGTDARYRDTDGDGHFDLPPQSPRDGNAFDVWHDNCPTISNPDQENTRADLVNLLATGRSFDDTTVLTSTILGDACNADIDGDRLTNVQEQGLGPGGPSHSICPSATANTDPMKLDTDGDGFTDRAECLLGTDPANGASKPPPFYATGDSDHDMLPDSLERAIGTDPTKVDTDGDKVNDGVEFLYYGSDPLNPNTDGDICNDGKEAASLNDDTKVNSTDQLILARSFSASGGVKYVQDFDLNRDGRVNSTDLLILGRNYGLC